MRSDYKQIEIRCIQHNNKVKKFFIKTNVSVEKLKERIIEIVNQKI